MQLYALGLNHHTAPLAIRERVAFQPELLGDALHDLTHAGRVREAAILSTCNRTELYFAAEQAQAAADWLARFHRLPLTEVSPYLYSYPQRDAIRHVFRVASGKRVETKGTRDPPPCHASAKSSQNGVGVIRRSS